MLPTDASRCECGYVFDAAPEDGPLEEELAVQEEELFEAYLEARLNQAAAELDIKRAELAADPGDFNRVARLIEAVRATYRLCGERDAQHAKTSAARRAAQAARSERAHERGLEPPPEPTISHAPTEVFRAAQAAQAERIMQAFAGVETKECPVCHTRLPAPSALCLCGYSFAHQRQMKPTAYDRTLDAATED